jgi:hypothetical protein
MAGVGSNTTVESIRIDSQALNRIEILFPKSPSSSLETYPMSRLLRISVSSRTNFPTSRSRLGHDLRVNVSGLVSAMKVSSASMVMGWYGARQFFKRAFILV